MPKREVLAAAACGAVATTVVNVLGITLLFDEAVVIVVSVVAGVLVMLGVAWLLDQ